MIPLVVVENPKRWPFQLAGVEVVPARQYLVEPRYSDLRGVAVYNICRNYGYQNVEGAAFVSCVHPQIVGQAHHMMWYQKLIEHMVSDDGVWFATTDEIADCWVDDEEDKRNMELPDIRTTAPRPSYYPDF